MSDPLDEALAAAGLDIWIGAEPTFTRRESNEPWWLWQADPDAPGAEDKRQRAEVVAAEIARRAGPASTSARVPGRLYPDEDAPRFCFRVASAVGDRALTVTADPGVVEVNTAPCPDLRTFSAHLRDVWAAATEAGLSSFRWRYNGDEVDSGGGGQLTLGGPSPERSPFLIHPALLPRMIRYLGNHPALSYWFLGECAGSACQAPRADEGTRERWEELRLACAWLEREAAHDRVSPERLWSTLAPLLVDAGGNSHRAELNVEKLWNPHLADRGKLGVIELRAFRMAALPEDMVAAAALMRAVAGRCAIAPYDEPATDWGPELHDRWALPWFLAADLDAVLDDLAEHGLALDAHHDRLRGFRRHTLGKTRVGPFRIELSRALEFWPLVGDLASQERSTSRLVDASSERLELVADCEGDAPLTVEIAGHHVVPRVDPDGAWRYHVLGLRRRQYVPSPGLVPGLPADEPLEITVTAGDDAVRLRWFAWRPDGGAYEGLPADDGEARRRRAERLVVEPFVPERTAVTAAPPPAALSTWTLDVRTLHTRPDDPEPLRTDARTP